MHREMKHHGVLVKLASVSEANIQIWMIAFLKVYETKKPKKKQSLCDMYKI